MISEVGMSTSIAKLCSDSLGARLTPMQDPPSQVHCAAIWIFTAPRSISVSHPHLSSQPSTEGREPQVCPDQCQDHCDTVTQCHCSSAAVFNTSLSPGSEGRHWQKQNMRAHHRGSSTPFFAWESV